MKGSKKVDINGKKVELRFDLGALCDFCDKLEIGLDEIDSALNKPSNLIEFIVCMSKDQVNKEDVRALEMSKLNDIFGLIQEASGNLKAPQGANK